jgi:hypothetical protein
MQLTKLFTYQLQIENRDYRLVSPIDHFTGIAAQRGPKLYVVSQESSLIYIGKTSQPMSSRLRGGMNANGENGYHGYAWRDIDGLYRLDIWLLEDCSQEDEEQHLETIEAETAFLFRKQSNQWPSGQTEIHFHKSNRFHRQCSDRILSSLNAA